jgi:peroxin-1
MPALEERIDILTAVTRKLHLAPSVLETGPGGENLREIAQRTEGYSGADLQAVVYNAQLEAIHDVLGDAELGDAAKNGDAKMNSADGSSKPGRENRIPEFTHFRFGDSNTTTDASKPIPSSQLTERALIAQKIQALQTMRRKQMQLQQQQQRPGSKDDEDEEGSRDEGERKDPQIQWSHIESSLATTRSSISAQERRRLEGIYREFVVGRNGEMPSGQGGTEIGGRTSLM